MARMRPYTGGQFSLELDEGSSPVNVGFITSIDGGSFKSDEVKNPVGNHHYIVGRSPGKPKYDDITVQVGMAASPVFWRWVKASLDKRPERRNGAIVVYDFKRRERQRRTFQNALISEIGFPALDASSKAAAALTLKIAPETIRLESSNPSNKVTPSYAPDEVSKQKLWLTSNFRFELERFKGDKMMRNAKIEAFSVKQGVLMNPSGAMLDTWREPGKLEIPNIQVSFPMADVEKWSKWYEEAVINGNYADQITSGSITYYASDREATELMRINLFNVVLTSLEFEKLEAHKEGIAKLKVSLSVEDMTLEGGDGTMS